jgi:hypothetical protein
MLGGSIVPAVHQRPIVVRLSCLVSALSPVLLTGCLWDMHRGASDRQQPTGVFSTPAAWRCDRQKSTVPTAEGRLEPCTSCTNMARTPQALSINKTEHTVPAQGHVAMGEMSAFVSAPSGGLTMRVWLLLLLVALVGCAGHRPQVTNVRLTPQPTLERPEAWVLKAYPETHCMAYLNVEATAQRVTWLAQAWEMPAWGSMMACPGSLKLCETIDLATCREVAQP